MEDTMSLDAIKTINAPSAIGPYSQAVRSGDLLFISGQIPLDPSTGEMVSNDIEAATHRVLRNLDAIARAAGAGLGQIVKTTIFLANMNDFTTVNEIYASYFTGTPPARSTIQVAALPRDAQVEIEAVVSLA
jgi:2-iminobutanoate/2-iminopropanoate deaminase